MQKRAHITLSILAVLLCFMNHSLLAQSNYSTHYYESKKYDSLDLHTEKDWDTFNKYTPSTTALKNTKSYTLKKEVFGWHPYWQGSSYYDYDYSLLSEISYFSYEVDANTGNPITTRDWLTTDLVTVAQNHGVKVSLTVTLFSNHELLLTNPAAKDTLIENLISLVKQRNANGINLDFEALPQSQGSNFTTFVKELCNRFHDEIPDSRISMAIPAVDWSKVFNVAEMNSYIDLFLIMGYGYHWSGSNEAGPVSPKNAGSIWSKISTTRSINYYLNSGISPTKLCLAVPYYGRNWETTSDAVPATATGKGATVKYGQLVIDYINVYQEYWDEHASCPAYIFKDNNNAWHQCWVDNAKSLAYKYDHVNLSKIAGIGIWAMGYEGTSTDLSAMIIEKFTNQDKTINEDLFTDTGGKYGNYFENENWTYTLLSPKNETFVFVVEELNIEQGADSLFIYDGASAASPLLKSYSGHIISIDTIRSSTNALCFRFISNKSNQEKGWLANWSSKQEPSSINKVEKADLSVYPNPFSTHVTVSLHAEKTQKSEIFILDLAGRLIYDASLMLKQGKNAIPIELNSKPSPGTYILGVKLGQWYVTEKIFIKN